MIALICAATILVGFEQPLTDRDKAAIKQAPKTCAAQYPEAPCCVELIRKEDGIYNALCGAEKSEK